MTLFQSSSFFILLAKCKERFNSMLEFYGLCIQFMKNLKNNGMKKELICNIMSMTEKGVTLWLIT